MQDAPGRRVEGFRRSTFLKSAFHRIHPLHWKSSREKLPPPMGYTENSDEIREQGEIKLKNISEWSRSKEYSWSDQ